MITYAVAFCPPEIVTVSVKTSIVYMIELKEIFRQEDPASKILTTIAVNAIFHKFTCPTH